MTLYICSGNIFVQSDGGVALLDCGQVKQISTKERIGLANLIVMVNRWEALDRQLRQLQEAAAAAGGGADAAALESMRVEAKRITSDIAFALRDFGTAQLNCLYCQ